MPPNRAMRLLDACAAGDTAQARQLLSELSIQAPHAPIPFDWELDLSKVDDEQPPSTLQMLEAATLHGKRAIVSLIFDTFPEAKVTPVDLENAMANKDVAMLKQLLDHDDSCVNEESDRSRSSLLASACYTDADAALLLLEHGGDPSGTDFLRRTALQAALSLDNRAEGTMPDIRVVRRLIEKGAKVDERALRLSASLEPAFLMELLRTRPDKSLAKHALSKEISSEPMGNAEAERALRNYAKSEHATWLEKFKGPILERS